MKLSTELVDETESLVRSYSLEKISGLAVSMCVLAAIFYCFEYYLRVAPSVMKAELKTTFLLSDAAFGTLASSCYYFAYVSMQIPVGMMFDKFGVRRILTFASFVCVLGTYLFATTQTLLIAQIGRFLIGFGSAFAYVGVLKITNTWLPQRYFALMVGVATMLGMVGAMCGELTMAYLVQRMGWQSTLYGSIVFGIVLTLLVWIILRDAKSGEEDESEKDFKKSSFNSEQTLPEVTVLRGLLKIIKNPQMWLIGFIGCLTYLPITAFAELWAVPFLETVGYSKPEAALGSSMIFLGFAVGGPCWGMLSEFVKRRRLPLVLGSLVAAMLMFFAIYTPSQTSFWMYLILFFCSFAASAQVLVFAIGNDINHSVVSATAVAFTNMVVMLGGLVLPPLIGEFLDNSVSVVNGLSVYNIQDYTKALIVLPICLVVSGFISLLLKESYRA